MRREGAEPLEAAGVTQALDYFSQCDSPCFSSTGRTTRWLSGVCTVYVYVVSFRRLDTVSANVMDGLTLVKHFLEKLQVP